MDDASKEKSSTEEKSSSKEEVSERKESPVADPVPLICLLIFRSVQCGTRTAEKRNTPSAENTGTTGICHGGGLEALPHRPPQAS